MCCFVSKNVHCIFCGFINHWMFLRDLCVLIYYYHLIRCTIIVIDSNPKESKMASKLGFMFIAANNIDEINKTPCQIIERHQC